MTSPTPAATAPSRAVAGVAVLGALVLLTGVALSARGVPPEDLDTVVSAASEGTVLVVGGDTRPARRGTSVPDGASVRTPAGGTAALSTGGRVVQLAPSSTVVVLDGARQTLVAGSALVEASEGPGLRLATDGGTRVAVRDDAVVRVEQASPVRVAAYRGAAEVGVDRRRARTTVDALHQVEVQGRTLPSDPTPLRLVPGDAWERAELETVVEADTDLRRTVAGYQEQGGVVVAALLDRDPALGAASAVVRAEQALAYALAHEGDDFDGDRYRALLRDREDGGSWGVVAALNGVSASAVDAFARTLVPGEAGEASGLVQAAGDPAADDVLGRLVGLPPQATAPTPGAAPPRPRRSTGPSPRPTASPGPGEPDPLPAPVRDVVDRVLDVLPVDPPAATTRSTPRPAVPPTRAPLLDVEVDLSLR